MEAIPALAILNIHRDPLCKSQQSEPSNDRCDPTEKFKRGEPLRSLHVSKREQTAQQWMTI